MPLVSFLFKSPGWPHSNHHLPPLSSLNIKLSCIHAVSLLTKILTPWANWLIVEPMVSGLVGKDMKVLHISPRKVTIVGIDNHKLTGLDVITPAAILHTNKGLVSGIFPEYAYGILSTLLVNLSGSKTMWMTNPSRWVP